MAAQDCWMNSKDLMALLKVPSQKMMEHNMSERDLLTVYFRELAMRVQKLPYDQRTDFISSHSSAWRDNSILTEELRLRLFVPLLGAIHSLNSNGLT